MATYKKLTKHNKNHKKIKKTNKLKQFKTKSISNNQKGGNNIISNINFIEAPNISTQENYDKDYYEVGIFHITDSEGMNWVKSATTAVGNFFGRKGFNNDTYNIIRQRILEELQTKLKDKQQKVCKFCGRLS
jgi:hypothetical protein